MKSKRALFAALLVATLGAGFLAPRLDDDFFAIRKSIEIYGAAYKALVGQYVDEPDPVRLMQTGLDAMLADLDPYTTFIDEGDRLEATVKQRGRHGDVGLELNRRGGKIVVTAPEEGASAYEQGIRTGDILKTVAGEPTADLTLRDVRRLLRGDPGTTVKVQIERTGRPQPLEFVLTRESVNRAMVSYSGFLGADTTNGVGYVHLDRFGRTAAEEVRAAVKELQKQGSLDAFLLDLRDNPGGLLRQAVSIVGLFAPKGTEVVSMRGRTDDMQRSFQTSQSPLAPDVPLVVLVNDLSASASEIVAGAVQDLDRGVVLGQTTYGKGLVQTVEELPYNTAIKLTVAEYYTPSGRNIQSKTYSEGRAANIPDSLRQTFRTQGGRRVQGGGGIMPDVQATPPAPSALEQALKRQASFFFFANEYTADHEDIGDDFVVTDALLQEFKSWLDERGFSYESDAERSLDALAQDIADAGYDGVGDEMSSLRQELHRAKQEAFMRHADALKDELRSAILAHHLSKSGQIAASLSHDPVVQRARELLHDEEAYREILD